MVGGEDRRDTDMVSLRRGEPVEPSNHDIVNGFNRRLRIRRIDNPALSRFFTDDQVGVVVEQGRDLNDTHGGHFNGGGAVYAKRNGAKIIMKVQTVIRISFFHSQF